MHCGVFTGSYGVIGVEFPKDEVGLLLYGTEDVFYSSYTHKCKNGVCVCVRVMIILALQATRRPLNDTSSFRTMEACNIKGHFLKTTGALTLAIQ